MSGPPRFRSERVGAGREHVWECSYRPTGEPAPAEPGTLDHFLAERYCLYTVDEAGDLHSADIHHPPWPLQGASAEIVRNTVPPDGLDVVGDPHLMFSARQDVLIWALERVL
jgi:uncharacterized protein YqjF (DUF2071 family)